MNKPLAIVLVSGGMDSCLTTALAAQQHTLACLHLNYGQKTQNRELRAFNDICDYYKVQKRLIVDAPFFKNIGGSSLTDKHIDVSKADLDNQKIPSSYVPFRNANILAIATSWAENLSAHKIYIGAVEEDSCGYPDCRDSFFRAFEKVIEQGTKPDTELKIITPLLYLSKDQIVKKAIDTGAPLSLSWSCYQNEDKACGVCDSCALRLRGFAKAGVEDPIPYMLKPAYE